MKPEVKKYLSTYLFLQDVYLFRKKLNPHFSYMIWAKELAIRNKAYLRLMVMGRRSINEATMQKLIANLELSNDDREYFVALLGYTQSKNMAERKVMQSRMMTILRRDFTQNEIDFNFEFLSHPLLPKLHSLLSFTDISQDVANLARLLGTDDSEIESGLAQLLEFGLIEKQGDSFKVLTQNFKLANKFQDLGLKSFYHNIFEEAKAAIHRPPQERRFRSLFFAMNEDEMKHLMERLNEFAQELLSHYNFTELEDRRLYQFHYNFFPLSNSQRAKNAEAEQAPL